MVLIIVGVNNNVPICFEMFDCTGSDVFQSIFEFHLFSDAAGEITIDSKDHLTITFLSCPGM